jgi:glycosyltransferase involved in cell wall biosynthesis
VKHILFVITQSDMGGAQNHVFDLIQGFMQDHKVSLLAGAEGLLTERAKALNIPYYINPFLKRDIHPWHDVLAIREMTKLLNTIKPDIVHAHSSKAGFISRLAGKVANVPVVFSAHGWVFAPGVPPVIRFFVWLMEVLVAPMSAHIVCATDYDRDLALRALPIGGKKISVVPYGIQPDNLMATPSSPVDKPIIIMPARFQQQKDQAMLIRSVAKLSHKNYHLWLVGDGPLMEECKRLADELKVRDNIEFLGNRTDLNQLLAKAHVFVLFSKYEGLPISIMEGMRAGLPVVATDVCGVGEEIDHEQTGYLVQSGDTNAAARALQNLLDNPDLRNTMGKKSREKFLHEFTRSMMLDRLKAIYTSLLPFSAITPQPKQSIRNHP